MRSATVLGKVLFRYIYVHMKRLDLHPITYGIPSLQHTVNGRLATLRKSTRTDSTWMVQYVQNTVVGAFRGGSGTFVSVPVPRPSHPTSWKWNPVWDNTFWWLDSQGFGLRLFPLEGWVFFICFRILVSFFCFCFFWWQNKRKKEKENKHMTVLKYCLTFQHRFL